VSVLAASVVAAASLQLLAGAPAAGAVRSLTARATADATVQKSLPTTSLGSASTLSAGASPLAHSYVQFSVSGVSGHVSRAVLRLYATDGSVDGVFSFGLETPSADATVFHATESMWAARRPQLRLTVDDTPRHGAGVTPTVETDPVPHAGDAADDPAIWVDPLDPSRSTVLGTDKHGGLAVYDLDGRQVQYLPVGDVNNVDIRNGFTLGGGDVSVATAGNRTDNSIGIWAVDPSTRQLGDVSAGAVHPGIAVYGSCMYHSPVSGRQYVFVNSSAGEVEQWELAGNGRGRVAASKVRAFDVGTTTEGCVSDDELGRFYIGEETVGIWSYGAEPGSGSSRRLFAATSPAGPLVADVDGLAIAYGPDGGGYLVASSQGNSSYVLYTRESGSFVRSFRVGPGNGLDGAEESDGLDVTTSPLGPAFPSGVFVVQDGHNEGNQNFKLVPYERVVP
jgi:3-phytase